jgi:hypothetical protein
MPKCYKFSVYCVFGRESGLKSVYNFHCLEKFQYFNINIFVLVRNRAIWVTESLYLFYIIIIIIISF